MAKMCGNENPANFLLSVSLYFQAVLAIELWNAAPFPDQFEFYLNTEHDSTRNRPFLCYSSSCPQENKLDWFLTTRKEQWSMSYFYPFESDDWSISKFILHEYQLCNQQNTHSLQGSFFLAEPKNMQHKQSGFFEGSSGDST